MNKCSFKKPYANSWRQDFPILNKDSQKLIYMDSASTTLKPKAVIDAVNEFYTEFTSNISRSRHFLSEKLLAKFDNTREKVASFINANKNEIIFTLNCTDAINLVAKGLGLTKEDEVIVSSLEHHSNFIPWKSCSNIVVVYPDKNGTIDMDFLAYSITKKTKLVSITYVSNVTGNVQPIKEIVKLVREKGGLCMIDAAQAVGHIPVDVLDLDCDFLAFSAHKMLGPSGVGVLYGKSKLLDQLCPYRLGGGMVHKVLMDEIQYMPSPTKFEAGTLNIEGILGLGAAIDYLNGIGLERVFFYLKQLQIYCRNRLESIDTITFPFAFSRHHKPIFSFIPQNSMTDINFVANILSDVHGIAVRDGYQCAQPLYQHMKLGGSIRASLYLYNTFEEIDILVDALSDMKYLLSSA